MGTVDLIESLKRDNAAMEEQVDELRYFLNNLRKAAENIENDNGSIPDRLWEILQHAITESGGK